MKNFFVIANKSKNETEQFQTDIMAYINQKGGCCINDPNHTTNTDPSLVPEDTECVIVLGGDGTLLRVACDLLQRRIPLLGINMGTLGFLTAVEKSEAYKAIDRMMADDYIIETRMMIDARVTTHDGVVESPTALNEVVVAGRRNMQLLNLSVFVNGQFLHSYRADGIIVATPTGSTGYSLSAGGPIIAPTSQMLILSPICPHSMHNRSIVLSREDVIEIVIDEGKYESEQEAEVIFDAEKGIKLSTGDRVSVFASENVTQIVRLKKEGFYETLQDKLREK